MQKVRKPSIYQGSQSLIPLTIRAENGTFLGVGSESLNSHARPFCPAHTTNHSCYLRSWRFTVDVCRIEGARLSYSNRWKPKTLKECGLKGGKRDVLGALMVICDWKGRVCKPGHEIASVAGISPRQCATILAGLIEAGYVEILQAGRGRRPALIQVVTADGIK